MIYADLFFAGGAVHTMDAARGRATAVAVRDGRIVTVGDDLGPPGEIHATKVVQTFISGRRVYAT